MREIEYFIGAETVDGFVVPKFYQHLHHCLVVSNLGQKRLLLPVLSSGGKLVRNVIAGVDMIDDRMMQGVIRLGHDELIWPFGYLTRRLWKSEPSVVAGVFEFGGAQGRPGTRLRCRSSRQPTINRRQPAFNCGTINHLPHNQASPCNQCCHEAQLKQGDYSKIVFWKHRGIKLIPLGCYTQWRKQVKGSVTLQMGDVCGLNDHGWMRTTTVTNVPGCYPQWRKEVKGPGTLQMRGVCGWMRVATVMNVPAW